MPYIITVRIIISTGNNNNNLDGYRGGGRACLADKLLVADK